MRVDDRGDLLVQAGGQVLLQHKPVVYQEVAGERRQVAANFVVQGQEVGFALGGYDPSEPLVIDPILSYSTYLGGSGVDDRLVASPWTRPATPTSRGVPARRTSRPLQRRCRPTLRRSVAERLRRKVECGRLDPGLLHLPRRQRRDLTGDLAWHRRGRGRQRLRHGADQLARLPDRQRLAAGSRRPHGNAFVAKLNADGSALVYSTYLGGSGPSLELSATGWHRRGRGRQRLRDGEYRLARLPDRQRLAAGYGRPRGNAFVAKLSADGSALVYSTYLGGSGYDAGYGIAVDAAGNAYVTGGTGSPNFPTANSLQPTLRASWNGTPSWRS